MKTWNDEKLKIFLKKHEKTIENPSEEWSQLLRKVDQKKPRILWKPLVASTALALTLALWILPSSPPQDLTDEELIEFIETTQNLEDERSEVGEEYLLLLAGGS